MRCAGPRPRRRSPCAGCPRPAVKGSLNALAGDVAQHAVAAIGDRDDDALVDIARALAAPPAVRPASSDRRCRAAGARSRRSGRVGGGREPIGDARGRSAPCGTAGRSRRRRGAGRARDRSRKASVVSVPRSRSAIVSISSICIMSFSSEASSCLRNSWRSSSGMPRFFRTYAMPLATVTGRTQLMRDVREEVGLGRREGLQTLGHFAERDLEVARCVASPTRRSPELTADAVAERHVAVQDRADRAKDRLLYRPPSARTADAAGMQHLRRDDRRGHVGPADTEVSGTMASSRRTRSVPPSPSRPISTTTTAGWVRAATSTARKPSVTTSSSRSAPRLQQRVLQLGEAVGRCRRAAPSWASPKVSASVPGGLSVPGRERTLRRPIRRGRCGSRSRPPGPGRSLRASRRSARGGS